MDRRPQDAGLPDFGGQRRVPGLRREELAQLAGISVDYYVRLEQGRNQHVSDTVLGAVARALQLSADELAHLRNLAKPPRNRPQVTKRQRVRPGLQRLLDTVEGPAYVVGRQVDILAWNDLGRAVFLDFAALEPEDRNWVRLVFLDDGVRELFSDLPGKARDVVAYLRMDAGRHPDDARLAALVGELSVKSVEFRKLWAGQQVRDKTHGHYVLRHPLVGELDLAYETLRLPDDPDQALIAYTAEACSPSEANLRLLASWGTEPADREAIPTRD
jgi:transcriptional regulator with XRE-family HTH domain